MESLGERIHVATATRVKFHAPAITLRDAGHWPGLRIERWEGDSEPLDETILPMHVLSVCVDTTNRAEFKWAGHRRRSSTLLPGSLTVAPAQLPYEAVGVGFGRFDMVGIAPSFLQSVSHGALKAPVELVPQLGLDEPLVRELVNALTADIAAGYPAGPMFGETLCVALAVQLMRSCGTSVGAGEAISENDALRREWVRSYLLDQIARPVSLAELAELLQLDMFSLIRWFKRAFGMPPHQYILRARVEKAKELLCAGDLSLAQVALLCGFNSQSHLTTAFRRLTGVAPGAYRSSRN